MRAHKLFSLTLGAIAMSAALHGHAQDASQSTSGSMNTASPDGTGRWSDGETSRPRSWIPFTSYGYVGANIGLSDLSLPGCAPGASCDDSGNGFKVYTGGQFSRIFGVEATYVQFLSLDRNGGDVNAKGLNLGLLANWPVTERVNLFGKVGAIYGWTRTGASYAGVPTGNESALNVSYGAGAQYDISRNWGVRADWDVYRLKFASGTSDATLYSLGAVYKF